jgi:hypothetical protein
LRGFQSWLKVDPAYDIAPCVCHTSSRAFSTCCFARSLNGPKARFLIASLVHSRIGTRRKRGLFRIIPKQFHESTHHLHSCVLCGNGFTSRCALGGRATHEITVAVVEEKIWEGFLKHGILRSAHTWVFSHKDVSFETGICAEVKISFYVASLCLPTNRWTQLISKTLLLLVTTDQNL